MTTPYPIPAGLWQALFSAHRSYRAALTQQLRRSQNSAERYDLLRQLKELNEAEAYAIEQRNLAWKAGNL